MPSKTEKVMLKGDLKNDAYKTDKVLLYNREFIANDVVVEAKHLQPDKEMFAIHVGRD